MTAKPQVSRAERGESGVEGGEKSEELGCWSGWGSYSSSPCLGCWCSYTLGKGPSLESGILKPHPGLTLLEGTWGSEPLLIFAGPEFS